MAESAKKFSLAQIKRDNKKFSETKRVFFNNDEYYIDIFPNFSNDKVQLLVSDLGKIFNKIQMAGIEVPDNLTIDFINCTIIKNFSNFIFPDETKKLVQSYMELIKSDYYKIIMNEYPMESIKKVFDCFYEGVSVIEQVQNKQREFKNELNEIEETLIED